MSGGEGLRMEVTSGEEDNYHDVTKEAFSLMVRTPIHHSRVPEFDVHLRLLTQLPANA